jgi:hypothetical protein
VAVAPLEKSRPRRLAHDRWMPSPPHPQPSYEYETLARFPSTNSSVVKAWRHSRLGSMVANSRSPVRIVLIPLPRGRRGIYFVRFSMPFSVPFSAPFSVCSIVASVSILRLSVNTRAPLETLSSRTDENMIALSAQFVQSKFQFPPSLDH